MKISHTLTLGLALAVGTIAVASTYATLRTTHLGAASAQAPRVSPAAIAHRRQALDRAQVALRAQLHRRPPALPRVPKAQPPAPSGAPAAPLAAPATAPRVVYVRPKPIVHVVHRHGEASGEGLDEGGGSDD
jgi:hypothetical protein